ncbi:MAG: ATP synthase F1 subunit gamma [Candidatus Binatia bacterium]
MAKIHKIRRRIKSVGKISQITAAMEKVAASKMRRALSATLRSRAYATSASEILTHLYQLTREQTKQHPLFVRHKGARRLIIVISSDRGLAGAYNSNIARVLMREAAARPKPRVIAIGRKGAQVAARVSRAGMLDLIATYQDIPTEPSSSYVQPIVTAVIEGYIKKDFDRVEVLYTDFVSSLRQVVTLKHLLPIDPNVMGKGLVGENVQEALFEPSPEAVLDFIVPRLVGIQVYQALLEAIASEQAMRMMAMKNASDNAGELIEDLTLSYNSARQAAITQELAEITVGAAAVQ